VTVAARLLESPEMTAALRALLSTLPYDVLGPAQVVDQQHLRRPKYDEWERLLFEEYRRERAELSYSLQTWGLPWGEPKPATGIRTADAWARWVAALIVSRCVFPSGEYERAQRHTMRSEFADALVPGHDRLRQERRVMNAARLWPTSFEDLTREYEDEESDDDPLDRLALEARAFVEPSSIEAMVDRRALRNLSSEDRAVLTLRTAFSRHPGHLAQVSGWTPAAARKRMQRARAKLQAQTVAEGEAPGPDRGRVETRLRPSRCWGSRRPGDEGGRLAPVYEPALSQAEGVEPPESPVRGSRAHRGEWLVLQADQRRPSDHEASAE
jgi:hypothetical protein